jgi:hypothetical protein
MLDVIKTQTYACIVIFCDIISPRPENAQGKGKQVTWRGIYCTVQWAPLKLVGGKLVTFSISISIYSRIHIFT